jgi:hypothetical protein
MSKSFDKGSPENNTIKILHEFLKLSFDKCSHENNSIKMLHEILPCLLTSVLSPRDIKDMGSKLENDFHQIGAVTHNFESGQT